MKKYFLLCLAFMAFSFISYGQCPPNDIILLTQQQVDDFAITYPNCTELTHGLQIGDYGVGGITNVDGLYPITTVTGDLELRSEDLISITGLSNLVAIGGDFDTCNCHSLLNISGLENLQSVGGNLWISFDEITNLNELSNLQSVGESLVLWLMNDLEDISGLSNLQSVGHDLRIHHASSLQSLNGLQNIQSINGWLWLDYLESLQDTDLTVFSNINSIEDIKIGHLPNLQSLSGLENITSTEGLGLSDLPSLQSLTGIENLQVASGSFWGWALEISNCPQLETITSLSNLQSINGGLTFNNLPNLQSLSPLSNASINNDGESCIIVNCSILSSLNGLENLTFSAIYGDFIIENNNALNDISALGGVTSVHRLKINNNDALTNLNGLENLNLIDFRLELSENDALNSIYALSNVPANGINETTITNNSSLANCDIMAVCDNLTNQNRQPTIFGNATGCANIQEVADACNVILSISETDNLNTKVSLYPNPVKRVLNIENTSNTEITSIKLYDVLGRLVMLVKDDLNQIDVSSINSGVFFLNIKTDREVVTKK